MNTPSPLVPQGAIPPKTASRPQRVLMVAGLVVALHVLGLSVVLLQGCGKDNGTKTAANNSSTDTNTALGYPAMDTNSSGSMFASATNAVATNVAHANTNLPPPPLPGLPGPGVQMQTPGATLAGNPQDAGLPGVPASQEPAATPSGPEKDYKVQKGDTLTGIASKNGITVGALMKSNANLDPKKLRVGQTIKVPAPVAGASNARAVAGTASVPPTSAGAASAGAAGTYKVKPGDTLTKIARAHGITVNQLRAANNMKTTQVQVGKVLKIPASTQKTAAIPAATSATH